MKNSVLPRAEKIIFLGILGVVTLFWMSAQIHQGVNTNILWLTEAAAHFLAGETMTQSFYGPNPPLCILIYAPAVLLVRCLHIPVYDAYFLYAIGLVALSMTATVRLLSYLDGIDAPSRFIFSATYFLGCTLVPGYYFGDRELIVMMGMGPLCLAQICLTRNRHPSSLLLVSSVVLGTVAVLVKPQFIVIPVLLILHRLTVKKDIRAFFTIDVFIMAIIIALYIALTALFFPDFIVSLLPDMALLYVISLHDSLTAIIACKISVPILIMIFFSARLKDRQKWFPLSLFAGSLLGIISFAAQEKIFYTHLLPSIIFFLGGASLFLHQFLTERKMERSAPMFALAFSILFAMAAWQDEFSQFIYPQYKIFAPYRWPTHEDYRNSTLVKLVRDHAYEKSYFIFGSMPIAQMPSAYSNSIHGSRFPSYWFLPGMIDAEETLKKHEQTNISAAALKSYKEKYTAMVVSDFEKYDPSLVILARLYMTDSEKEPFDFISYFSFDPDFARLWAPYRKIQTLSINSRDYYGGYDYGNTDDYVTYDVYIKNEKIRQH